MKKQWLCLLMLGCILLSGCSSQTEEQSGSLSMGTEDTVVNVPVFDWGITLTVKNVTAKGLTLICTQSGGEPTGELQTGSWYEIQKLENGVWKKAEYTQIEEEYVGWTSEAWCIPKEDTVEWDVDWTWLYDTLPEGQYRIGKEIMDFRDIGEYDETVLYAEFSIR